MKLHADIAHPINIECRKRLQGKVISAFQEEVEKSGRPDDKPDEPEDKPVKTDEPENKPVETDKPEDKPVEIDEPDDEVPEIIT
jgi:stage V sporulation protein G